MKSWSVRFEIRVSTDWNNPVGEKAAILTSISAQDLWGWASRAKSSPQK